MKYINLMFFLLFTPFLWSNEALIKALENEDIKKAMEIIENDESVDINIKNDDGYTPLIIAIAFENFDLVKYIVEKGADLNIKDDDGRSPLSLAMGDYNIFLYLIKSRADVNVKDNFGFNLLHYALTEKDDSFIDIILDRIGKDAINERTIDGYTPLHLAINRDIKFHVQKLVANGADVNIKANDGKTALHTAAYDGDLDLIRFLLANGADADIRNNEGKLAKDLVSDNDIKKEFTYFENFNKTKAELEKIKNIKIKTPHEERIDKINALLFDAIYYFDFNLENIKDLYLAFPLEIFTLIFSYLPLKEQLQNKELAKTFYMLVKNDPKLKERIQRLPIYEKIYYLRKFKVKDIPPAIGWDDFKSLAEDLQKRLNETNII